MHNFISLTQNEKSLIQASYIRFVIPNLTYFAATYSEDKFMHYLLDRTLRWGKLSEYGSLDLMRRGMRSSGVCPKKITQTMWFKAKVALRERNTIYYKEISAKPVPTLYFVNLYGILSRVEDFVKEEITGDDAENFFGALHFLKALYDSYGVEKRRVKLVNVSDEFIDDECKKTKTRKDQLTHKRGIKGGNLREKLKLICEEEEVECGQITWTKKEQGQARNWIKECRASGREPEEVLREVCRSWENFRLSLKVGKYQKGVMLSPGVNFSEFYMYRREIFAVMAGAEEANEYEVKEKVYEF